MWRPITLVLAIFMELILPSLAQSQKDREGYPMVELNETVMTILPSAGPNNLHNCARIYADGHFRLELTRQEALGSPSSGGIYEGTLKENSVQHLSSLIDADDAKTLRPVEVPKTPLRTKQWTFFQARIPRKSGVQDVGYFAWSGDAPEVSGETKQNWSQAETVLQPLQDWLHVLKSFGAHDWKEVTYPGQPMLCGQ